MFGCEDHCDKVARQDLPCRAAEDRLEQLFVQYSNALISDSDFRSAILAEYRSADEAIGQFDALLSNGALSLLEHSACIGDACDAMAAARWCLDWLDRAPERTVMR